MKSFLDVCYSLEHKQYLDIHLPEYESFPVLVYFHGGGFESGDKADEMVFFKYMTDKGIAIASVNYRMYPQAKYPDFLMDCAEAVAWVIKNANTYGNVTKVFVGGSSAGGYASQMLCFDGSLLAKHGLKASDISGFIHDAGQPTCHFNVLKERGMDFRRIVVDEAAPLYHIKDNENYPPMLILVADDDIPHRYEQTMLVISTLKHFGYVEGIELKVMSGKHVGYVNTVDENGESIFGKVASEFIFRN